MHCKLMLSMPSVYHYWELIRCMVAKTALLGKALKKFNKWKRYCITIFLGKHCSYPPQILFTPPPLKFWQIRGFSKLIKLWSPNKATFLLENFMAYWIICCLYSKIWYLVMLFWSQYGPQIIQNTMHRAQNGWRHVVDVHARFLPPQEKSQKKTPGKWYW